MPSHSIACLLHTRYTCQTDVTNDCAEWDRTRPGTSDTWPSCGSEGLTTGLSTGSSAACLITSACNSRAQAHHHHGAPVWGSLSAPCIFLSESRWHRSTAPAGVHLAGLQAGRAPHDLAGLEQERAQRVRPQDGLGALLGELRVRRHKRGQLLGRVDEIVVRNLAQIAELADLPRPARSDSRRTGTIFMGGCINSVVRTWAQVAVFADSPPPTRSRS